MPRILLLLFLLLFVSSCRTDGGAGSGVPDPGPGGVERSLTAFQTAFEAVAAGLTAAFTQGTETGEITKFEHFLLCDPENSISLKETVSDNGPDGTFLIEADLDECQETRGDLSALGSFARSPQGGLLFQWAYDGDVRNGDCDVDLSDLTISSDTQQAPAVNLLSGVLTADCDGDRPASVNCSWNQTPVSDEGALAAACTCSGPGC